MRDEDKKIEALANQARGGDEKALSDLIDLVQPRLFRFCYYLTGNKELAEDICQDSIVKVLTKIGSLKDPKLFIQWIFKAAKNSFLDYIKSHKVSRTDSIEEKGDLYQESDSQRVDLIASIKKVLSALNEEDRYIILLVDQQGYSYKEASEIIGITEAALTMKIHRIRKAFLEIYGEE